MLKTPLNERVQRWLDYNMAMYGTRPMYITLHPKDYREVLEHPKRHPQFEVLGIGEVVFNGKLCVPLDGD